MFIVNDLGLNEPFGPMILSAILKQKGYQTALGVIQIEDLERKILSWKPDMLAYSMMSVDMKDMKEFNDSFRKKHKIFTLLGGPHPTLDRGCINDPGIDAICVGEGEEAIVDVVEHLEAGRSIEGIPNILTSCESPLKLRSLIEDFDAFPFMDRELVYSYPQMARFGVKGIWSRRGCAFRCPYCFNDQFHELFETRGRYIRRRNVDSVIRETKELASNHRVAFIRIQDDVFVYKVDEWLKEFAEKWSAQVNIPFYCDVRCELVTEEMAFYLKKAGCFSVCMSVEAADDDVRMRMLRRKATKQQMENAFRIFKKYKLNVYANTMLAMPFTTLEHDIASLDFVTKVQPEMPNFSIFMPYPGTDLGDYCARVGIYDPVKSEIDFGMRNISPLTCFSQKQREAQYNLCELAIVAIKFPFLRNLIVKHLIYWKPNKIFFLIHYIFAVTAYGRKIFNFKHTFGEYLELVARSLKHYFYDFTRKKKIMKIPETGKSSKSAVLLTEEQRKEEFERCADAMANS